MSTEPDLSQHLAPHVYRQLQAYQQQQNHPTLMVALNALLQTYFVQVEEQHAAPLIAQEMQQQMDSLENRVYALTREIMAVRQSVPDQCDRLREQLAAVRLSHSGLLENLRQRLEAIEQRPGAALDDPLPLESLPNPPEQSIIPPSLSETDDASDPAI